MQAPGKGSVPRRTRLASALVAMTALVLVAGCASNKTNTGTYSPASGAQSVAPGSNLARAEVAKWANTYEKDRSKKTAILGYSNALSQNGQIEQSMAVLRAGVIAHQ